MVLDVRRPLAIDGALAAGIAVVQVAGTYLAGRHQVDRETFDALAGVLLVTGPAALVVRRRFPVAVYARPSPAPSPMSPSATPAAPSSSASSSPS